MEYCPAINVTSARTPFSSVADLSAMKMGLAPIKTIGASPISWIHGDATHRVVLQYNPIPDYLHSVATKEPSNCGGTFPSVFPTAEDEVARQSASNDVEPNW